MDRSFWQAIKENNFAIPSGYSVEFLTEYLLTALGNTDPEIREENRSGQWIEVIMSYHEVRY